MKKITSTILAVLITALFVTPVFAQEDSWQSISSLRDIYNMYCMTFFNEQNGWAAGQGIIVHTADGGKTWEKHYIGPARIKCIYFKNAKDGFAGGESNCYMTTHDGGATWKADFSTFQSCVFTKIFFVNPQTGYMLSTGGVYRTLDGGATWKDIGPKRPEEFYNRDFNGLVARDAKHLIVVGDKEMLFTSDDGGTTWKQNTKDMFTGDRRNFYGVAFKDANTGWVSCSSGSGDDIDCLYTTDGGASWTTKKVFNGYQLKTFEFNKNCGWATSRMNDKMIYVTYDGGATWNEQKVTGEHKVLDAYIFSPKAAYVGVNGRDYYFRLFMPK